MRRLSSILQFSFALFLALGATGCPDNLTADDFGISPAGCRLPQRCYFSNCTCESRATVYPLTPMRNSCIACDPSQADAAGNCFCDPTPTATGVTSICEDPVAVCVGKGVVCLGEGARCVPAGGTCAPGQGDVPQLVGTASGTDAGPDEEPHCAFPDDVCCAGVVNDMSANAPDDL